ncbi:MAG: hypothetical protein ABSC10_00040 [Candidatus Acidiferrales bacterium]
MRRGASAEASFGLYGRRQAAALQNVLGRRSWGASSSLVVGSDSTSEINVAATEA